MLNISNVHKHYELYLLDYHMISNPRKILFTVFEWLNVWRRKIAKINANPPTRYAQRSEVRNSHGIDWPSQSDDPRSQSILTYYWSICWHSPSVFCLYFRNSLIILVRYSRLELVKYFIPVLLYTPTIYCKIADVHFVIVGSLVTLSLTRIIPLVLSSCLFFGVLTWFSYFLSVLR